MTGDICSGCGSPLKRDASFCSACGINLTIKRTARKTGRVIFGRDLLLLIVMVLISGTAFLFYTVRSQPSIEFQHPAMSGMTAGEQPDFDKLIAGLPDDYGQLVNLGNTYMDRRIYPIAIECYRRALEVDSTNPDVHTDLGACLHAVGDFPGAVTALEKAVGINPRHAVANFNLGVVYRSMNDLDKTRYYWEKYIELVPESPIADTLRTYMNQW